MKKQKNLNRRKFIDYLKEIQCINVSFQTLYSGKNIYFVGNNEDEADYQIEFISETKSYFYTVMIRGMKETADDIHSKLSSYLKNLELGRNIVLDTEHKSTII